MIDSIISYEQSTFIKDRHILDGPMMINKLVEWYKRKMKKVDVSKD